MSFINLSSFDINLQFVNMYSEITNLNSLFLYQISLTKLKQKLNSPLTPFLKKRGTKLNFVSYIELRFKVSLF
jgi:hypothetical protein